MKKFLGFIATAGVFMMTIGSYMVLGFSMIAKAKEVGEKIDKNSKKSRIIGTLKILGLLTGAGYFFYCAHNDSKHIDDIYDDYIDEKINSAIEEDTNDSCCEESCDCE